MVKIFNSYHFMKPIVKIIRTIRIAEPKEIREPRMRKAGMYFLDTTGICD